eukprot:CAMPEP_0206604820 /NCGR_PEP_ID=MMETSP0325_2-20121206/49810_1 /ASSEMBLY_ACC=CAM_ASM_000347 /TAXON_ID=2866 /ORGANISM="Crypthecodinium cohnii, Strain Seligo" /LENGTH=67 /DNA_ID=CAMNT_0054119771 /DNA_START=152 /DNA_END=352 /DNA_ORIENTATION=+
MPGERGAAASKNCMTCVLLQGPAGMLSSTSACWPLVDEGGKQASWSVNGKVEGEQLPAKEDSEFSRR